MTDTELLSSYMPKRTELQAKLISVPVNQIHHGTRFRSDLGDIEGLAENIRENACCSPSASISISILCSGAAVSWRALTC